MAFLDTENGLYEWVHGLGVKVGREHIALPYWVDIVAAYHKVTLKKRVCSVYGNMEDKFHIWNCKPPIFR